jgi:hypothetical protein
MVFISLQYGVAMINDGNKPEWAAQACASMVILCQSDIEAHIPEKVVLEDTTDPNVIHTSATQKTGTVFDEANIGMRAKAKEILSKVMLDCGADYSIIELYLKDQRSDSWRPNCRVLKYFLVQQQQDTSNLEDRYFFKGDGISPGPDAAKTQFDKHFQPEDASGPEQSQKKMQTYSKTVAMYKAFTAIALMKCNFPGKNLKSATCTLHQISSQSAQLQRGMQKSALITAYQWYGDLKAGETFVGIKGGIAESTALGPPVIKFA